VLTSKPLRSSESEVVAVTTAARVLVSMLSSDNEKATSDGGVVSCSLVTGKLESNPAAWSCAVSVYWKLPTASAMYA
jgi:hypothetical protein